MEAIPAYNINKPYHLKEYNWVGYVIKVDKIYYIAGDTDITMENSNIKCDIAFIPIGGKYTMNYIEASKLVNKIKPKEVIPIHYGTIVGERALGNSFKELLDKNINCNLYL
jgi:L-ascorbate metabolism protein UlaG (beta-lactamase superfamily)